MADVVMPRLSDSMEEGTILQWLKAVGDDIAVGDELVEIETDKANMAYESDVAGTLSEILVQEGETVAIGTPIAQVGDSDEGSDGADNGEGQAAQPAGPVAAGDPPPPAVAKASSGVGPPTAPPAGRGAEPAAGSTAEARATDADAPAEDAELPATGDGHRPKASPLARRIAKEQGLDLTQLEGSGPGGRIVKADVERAASAGGAVGSTATEEASATGRGGGSPAATGPAALALCLFTLAAAACSLLALANAPVGPTSYSPKLTELRPLLVADSTLVLAPDRLLDEEHGVPYLAWELRGGRVCIESEAKAGDRPPPGVRYVIAEGDDGGVPPFPGLVLARRAGPYLLWERPGTVGGPSPCPLIAVRQARQGP